MADVSICMITFNKLPFLQKTFDAICGSLDDDLSYEFFVWNNGSDDGTRLYLDLFKHACPANVLYKVWHNEENIGLNAYGMIVPEATGKIIVTADDDIFEIMPPGWEYRFEKVLYNKFSGRRFGYLGTDTINEDGGRAVGGVIGIANLDDLVIEVGPVGGWFTATTKYAMDAAGGFHTSKEPMHLEDADIQKRMWESGYLCGTLLNTKVLHARAPHYYTELGRESTYIEKMRLAREVGISLEPIT